MFTGNTLHKINKSNPAEMEQFSSPRFNPTSESRVLIFVAKTMPLSVQYAILKSCIVFCAKTKEVDHIKLISVLQISVSLALKYIINNSV